MPQSKTYSSNKSKKSCMTHPLSFCFADSSKLNKQLRTSIFQQARTNIARCPTTQTPQHYMSEHNRNVETIRKSLHSKGPKGKVPPTWKPKDLDESISSSSKHDTTYFVHEAARQLKTRVKNPSEEERFYAAKQNSPGGAGLESEGGAPQHRREETSGVQKNVLDVSRDPRLHRR